MGILSWCYALLLSAVVAYTVVDDVRERRAAWYVVLEIVGGAALVLFIVVHGRPGLEAGLGRVLLPLLVLSILWEAISTAFEIDAYPWDPEDTPSERRVAVVGSAMIYLALIVPAQVLGVVAVRRAMGS